MEGCRDSLEDNKIWILLLLIFPAGFIAWKIFIKFNPCSSNYIFYCNETQQCIIKSQICNRFQDCPNDLDESNCKCFQGEYSCSQGRCIEGAFICDGITDCVKGDDEVHPNCRICRDNEWFCYKDNKCVSRTSLCDGYVDCWNGHQDEMGCVELGGIVKITISGEKHNLCADNWQENWNNDLCYYTGNGLARVYSQINLSNLTNTVFGEWRSREKSFLFEVKNNCSGNVVSLHCQEIMCGKRLVNSSSTSFYIINGVRAEPGAWPWFVILFYKNQFICGGVLVGNKWVMTAAHCLSISQTPSHYKIGVGGMHLKGEREYKLLSVSRIVSYNTNVNNLVDDIALMKLSEPVEYTEFIQPICLPRKGYAERFYKVCVIIGHGTTLKDRSSNSLLQARMAIYSPLECEAIILIFRNIRANGSQICMGSGTRKLATSNICQGDSGGPVMCLDPFNDWVVIGINSYVLGTKDLKPGSECQISFAARVTYYLEWVKNITSSG